MAKPSEIMDARCLSAVPPIAKAQFRLQIREFGAATELSGEVAGEVAKGWQGPGRDATGSSSEG